MSTFVGVAVGEQFPGICFDFLRVVFSFFLKQIVVWKYLYLNGFPCTFVWHIWSQRLSLIFDSFASSSPAHWGPRLRHVRNLLSWHSPQLHLRKHSRVHHSIYSQPPLICHTWRSLALLRRWIYFKLRGKENLNINFRKQERNIENHKRFV